MAGAWNWRWAAKWATLVSLGLLSLELTVLWLQLGAILSRGCFAAQTAYCEAVGQHLAPIDLDVGLVALVAWVMALAALAIFRIAEREDRRRLGPTPEAERGGKPATPARSRRDALVAATLALAISLAGAVAASDEYQAALCNDNGACGFYPNTFETVALTVTTTGQCAGASDVQLLLNPWNSGVTTGDFGISLTLQGASATTPSGTAGAVNRTACGVSPPNSGWIALLTSESGTGEAFFDTDGWHSWNQTLPINLYGGESLTILSSTAGSPVLDGAQLELYPTNADGVNGFTTL